MYVRKNEWRWGLDGFSLRLGQRILFCKRVLDGGGLGFPLNVTGRRVYGTCTALLTKLPTCCFRKKILVLLHIFVLMLVSEPVGSCVPLFEEFESESGKRRDDPRCDQPVVPPKGVQRRVSNADLEMRRRQERAR